MCLLNSNQLQSINWRGCANIYRGELTFLPNKALYVHDFDSPAANFKSQNKIFGLVDSKHLPRSPWKRKTKFREII